MATERYRALVDADRGVIDRSIFVDDDVFAVHNTCTHALEGMAGGFVDGDCIECPRHGAMFSLRTGEPLTPPATKSLPTFPVDVRDGRVLVSPTPSAPHPILDR